MGVSAYGRLSVEDREHERERGDERARGEVVRGREGERMNGREAVGEANRSTSLLHS
jgi:hypothetical protein